MKKDCGCSKKNTNRTKVIQQNLGEYTYEELEVVYTMITTKVRLTTEESDVVWELYNRVFHTDKLVNRRNREHAGKVGRNLIKLYENERERRKQQASENGETEGSVQTETDRTTDAPIKKRRSKKTS